MTHRKKHRPQQDTKKTILFPRENKESIDLKRKNSKGNSGLKVSRRGRKKLKEVVLNVRNSGR